MVWQTGSDTACCLSVLELGVLGVLCCCTAHRNPSTLNVWCLYATQNASGLFQESFGEKREASVCINVGLDVLHMRPYLVRSAVSGADTPSFFKFGVLMPAASWRMVARGRARENMVQDKVVLTGRWSHPEDSCLCAALVRVVKS